MLSLDGGLKISFLTNKKVLYLFVLIISGFLFCGAASASTVNVVPGTGTIQAAVTSASAGDTLNLSAGNYNDHAVTLNKNLTIQGPTVASGNPPTAVVDAQNINRIFYIPSGVNVTLKNLLLKNGNIDEAGGGVYNEGKLTVISCTFNNNYAIDGGAIENGVLSTCTVTNSTFNNNNATDNGGAIENYYGTCTVSSSTFTSNKATSGGTIRNYAGTCTVSGSTFTSNNATYGGVIINGGTGTFTITGSTLTHNNATDGGAIHNYDGTCTVTNSTFISNTGIALGRGGAIHNYNGILSVTDGTFTVNTAYDGGVVYNSGTCTLSGSTLTHNNATDGGAVYNIGTCTVSGSTFTNNNATKYLSYGGAVYNSGTCTVTTSTFNNNYATQWGGAISNIGTCTVSSSMFTNNTGLMVGGAICNVWYGVDEYGNCTLIDSIFINNHAGNHGGAVAAYGGGTINGCTFTGNTAGLQGGAIMMSRYGTVNNCTFTSNSVTLATSRGGAICSGGYACNVTNCTFTGNTATGSGGAIKNMNDAVIIVTGCNFAFNGAPNGNAIYNDNGDSSHTIVNYNRFYDTASGYEIYSDSGSMNAMYNWWGSNSNPISKVYGTVDVNPWLILTVNATPSIIGKDSTSTITADLNHDSGGFTHTNHVIDGIPISFTTSLGTINSPVSTVNGVAAATLHGGSVAGTAYINALLDSQTVPTSVVIETDTTPPTVISTNPVQYAVNLPSNQVFTVTYSEAIKAGNLNLVVLKTSTGTIIATTKTITGNVLTITPNSALGEAKYLLLLYAGSVTDLAGNPSAALSRTYGVGAQPYVTTTDPANYAVNVARNKVITATFNEPIVAKYLTLIYLKTAIGGILVATTKSVSGNVLTITPNSPLAAGTRYMLLIYTFAVTDLAGNSNVNKAISFTTGSL